MTDWPLSKDFLSPMLDDLGTMFTLRLENIVIPETFEDSIFGNMPLKMFFILIYTVVFDMGRMSMMKGFCNIVGGQKDLYRPRESLSCPLTKMFGTDGFRL
jgi:hypothetical protein